MIKKLALMGVAGVLAASFSMLAMAEGSYVVELKCEKRDVPKKLFQTFTDDSDEALFAAVKQAVNENWCGYAFKDTSYNLFQYSVSISKK